MLFNNYSNAQIKDIQVLTFEKFTPILHQNNDTVYVINFWATWCRPCVAELPHFEKLNSEYSYKAVKVILVSLDFADDIETRLKPFINKRNIKSQVILLNETDPNNFIDKVSTKWSGAIPASYIYKGSEAEFFEKSFTYEELKSIVEQKLN